MNLRKRNAFTLIELIATLVIMAIIALIATPLVMNVIRSARTASDKRSIDAYGRSIELAIASHLLDTGKFATSIDELTIEYSGDNVTCETTQINSDSSVYLSGCKVKNRDVTNYTYGTDKSPSYTSYQVGDHVSYNGVTYYVIEDSNAKNNVVKLLKEEPISYEEIENLSLDFEIDFYNINGYGGVRFDNSSSCGPWGDCNVDYVSSDVKNIVDAWIKLEINSLVLKSGRLMYKDEYEKLVIEETYETPTEPGKRYVPMYDWQCNNQYKYWLSTSVQDSSTTIWSVYNSGLMSGSGAYESNLVIRPVVELYKTATITILES